MRTQSELIRFLWIRLGEEWIGAHFGQEAVDDFKRLTTGGVEIEPR